MFRKAIANEKTRFKDPIKWRGHEITRMEAFSDAVFAFAVTLLIMSLEVPKSYDELIKAMQFIIPFGICFGITMTVWYNQNLYFRRYGLHDPVTIWLNCILVFLVLVYMFPLKFLIGSLFSREFQYNSYQDVTHVYAMYSGGFCLFYTMFTLMYWNAYAKREQLNLAPIEIFATISSIYTNIVIVTISAISVYLALLGARFITASYMIYMAIGPIMAVLHKRRYKIMIKRFGVNNNTTNSSEVTLAVIPDDDIQQHDKKIDASSN